MARESRYFTLSLESLRAIGGWAADCAERVLPVFERHAVSDTRPRAAIEGIREFAGGGKRVARLRSLALAAHAAAREVGEPAAAAAARAAGHAAASAYTHPLADVQQTKHIVGPSAYAALALELSQEGDQRVADDAVRWAITHAPAAVREVLLQMPVRPVGKSRLDVLLYQLDAGLRVGTVTMEQESMVTIEPATVADVPRIKQVLSETWRATYSSFLSEATIHTATSVWHSPERLAAETQHPRVFFGVARTSDGVIVGLITVGHMTDDLVMLARLYVLPEYQHQGIGGQLLQAGISAFPTARTVRLEVEEQNQPAYTFYQHHGFHAIERKEERVESDVISVVVMEKYLA